ncbi:hypothetical protein IB262_33260 [Ensifer sp. ENS02]|uniref:hypothetical protein n=1 Tax=Ensifer sp. ENS02 TaxID=2769290 RepID=UPI001783A9BA|nr:hypothetical protein [Ensifer sp. ENS02]MBD9524747.1 hypothetical protein [Ensifer sp. ENS02]
MAPAAEQAKRDQEAQEKPAAPAAPVVATSAQKLTKGHNQIRDFSALNNAAARDKLVPAEVEAAYNRDPKNPARFVTKEAPSRTAFEDKGNRLSTSRTFDDQAVDAIADTADARG